MLYSFSAVSADRINMCDTAYFNVVISGRPELVEDIEEKTEALSSQFVDKYHSDQDNMKVAVHKILPLELTAKENPMDMEHMFRVGGRQV